MIPQEIKAIKQWTYSFGVADLKRPKHSHYTPNGSLSYEHAFIAAKTGHVSLGWYTTFEDPYFIGDIDHIEDPEDPTTLPPALTDLLVNKGLYCEASPSGNGLRFVGKLPSVEDKAKLLGKIFYTKFPVNDKREAQLNIGPPWLRFTGKATAYSSGSIPTLTLDELGEVFALKFTDGPKLEGVPRGTPSTPAPTNSRIPSLQEMVAALKAIPLDQNPRIIRAYEKVFKETYSHYNFWLRILMGVHDYASLSGNRMECLQHIVDWSRKDEASFVSDDDVIAKWQSLSEKDVHVSFHTVFAVAYNTQIIWPMPRPITRAQKKEGLVAKQPMNSEFSNFKAVVDFYNIVLYRDSHAQAKMYVSGDSDILEKYFTSYGITQYYETYWGIFVEKTLTSAFHIMAQDLGFVGITHVQMQQHIRDWIFQITEEVDLVRKYFDTPFDELPESYKENGEFYEISTVERMFACLELDYLTTDPAKETALYFKYYKSWLMGFVRALYWSDDPYMNSCVLLLSGREQIRKTSHFLYMLPKFMRPERIALTTHGFATEGAMRDMVKLAAGNSIIIWDEIERYLTAETESNFKKLIDNNPQKFIDKYAVVESVYRPIAIYGATSNKREFNLSDTGNRRIFHIPVKWVDTEKLDRICWHRIVLDLKGEIEMHKGPTPPWLLTEEELKYQDSLHTRITAQSGLELLVREIFNFNLPCFLTDRGSVLDDIAPLKDPRFMSTKAIVDRLTMHSNGRIQINRAQLNKVLQNLCGRWTDTKNASKVYTKPKMIISKGMATYASTHRLWVVPPLGNPYEDKME